MWDRLSTTDYAPLATGGKRWEKNVNFAKKQLADDLLVRSDKSKWHITDRGKQFLKSGRVPSLEKVPLDETLRYLRKNREALLREIKTWFEREHGRDSVELAVIEASLHQLIAT
jgi:hypothetical protein